ncbi:MAG: hypothetical protein J6R15_02935 [Bacteroidales bacterium]|jgi:hypothetical protein|nr:hypothetical protein [Bacteroidales bacterium]
MMRLVLLGGMLCGQACSVKEDRSVCPCVLSLDFVSSDNDAEPVGLVIATSDGIIWEDVVEAGRQNGYQVSVPRADIHVRAWTGAKDMASESGITIPVGEECPEVYMHDSDLAAQGERMHETVTLRKNHCILTLLVEGGGMSSDLRIRGNVAGYDDLGFPLPGIFSVLLDGIYEGGYKAVLPRQKDASLMLEIDEGAGSVKAFALGQYMAASGYDWDAPDLDDVTVILDYALTELRLVISGWESVYRYDIEI